MVKKRDKSVIYLKDKSTGQYDRVVVKKGRLHRQLKVPLSHTFSLAELEKLQKIDNDKSFKFKGNDFKMTKLLKRRINFAVMLMKKSKGKAKKSGGSLDEVQNQILTMD